MKKQSGPAEKTIDSVMGAVSMIWDFLVKEPSSELAVREAEADDEEDSDAIETAGEER